MMVNGPLEIYSTVLGAKLYGDLFNIFRSSGLVFIPLLAIFFDGLKSALESENGADSSIREVGIQLVLYVVIIMLFVAPTWSLNLDAITYRPACSPNAELSTLGHTGTTYDNAFEKLRYEKIRIPLGMAFVLNGASGITNAAIVSITKECRTDVQKITDIIDTTQLTPILKEQVGRFNQECFAEARSRFQNEHPDKSTWESMMKAHGGETDLSWMGSHVFRSLYYSDIYPSATVPGFPVSQFQGASDYQKYNQKKGIPVSRWGRPSCEEWWSNSEYGLEAKLVSLVEKHKPKNPYLGTTPLMSDVARWLTDAKKGSQARSQVMPSDVVVHALLYNPAAEAGFGRGYTGWMNIDESLSSQNNSMDSVDIAAGAAAEVGQGISMVGSAIDRQEISQEIPILQAILMALCLSLGPLILIMGRYKINVIVSYYFILSSIMGITFIEKLIHYIELSLHVSMSYDLYSLGNAPVLYNVFTKLYLYAPLLFLMLMSICGVAVGNAVNGAFSNSVVGAGSGIGSKIAGSVKGVAKTAATVAE